MLIAQHKPFLPFLYPQGDVPHLESWLDTLSSSRWKRMVCDPKVFGAYLHSDCCRHLPRINGVRHSFEG